MEQPVLDKQRWRLHFKFRSFLLSLFLASSTTTAVMLLAPGLYSGCETSAADTATIISVLVVMPAIIYGANIWCHTHGLPAQHSKLVLMPLLLGYYVPIVAYDSQSRVMESFEHRSTSCQFAIRTSSNHTSDTMMLVDFACNFFVSACLLESWRSRSVHLVCHMAIWASDNLSYPSYVSEGTRAQRGWHWAGFLLVELQFMATIIAVAQAIDVVYDAQRERVRLEARIDQISNEKERLVWDSVLWGHKVSQQHMAPELLPEVALDEEMEEDVSRSSHRTCKTPSTHYTAKLGT